MTQQNLLNMLFLYLRQGMVQTMGERRLGKIEEGEGRL